MGLISDSPPQRNGITIGILGMHRSTTDMCVWVIHRHTALQGAFAEHQHVLERLSLPIKISVVLVRTADDLAPCDALIIPGGGVCYNNILFVGW